MKGLITFLLCISLASTLEAQKIFNNCGMDGNAKSQKIRLLNRDKNRYRLPDNEEIDQSITLEKMLEFGNDDERFLNTQAAEITGYVVTVKRGGVETCNCLAKEVEFQDAHIELVINPEQTSKNKRVVVEMTPRLRKKMADKGIDWSTQGLKNKIYHKWVKIRGWLFFDSEHWYNAYNTNPDGDNVWRATAWEIHPVTAIEVVE